MPRDKSEATGKLQNNIKQQLTGKGTSNAHLSCACVCSKPCTIPRVHPLPAPSEHMWAASAPNQCKCWRYRSCLDYKDSSRERKQHRLLETTGEPLLFYLAVSWNLVLQQGREPEWFPPPIVPFCPSFPPECHLVGHREENRKKEECLCQRTWLQTFSGCFPKSPDTFLSPQIHS